MKNSLLFLSAFLLVHVTNSQPASLVILNKDTRTSLRGLSVVNDHIIWVSGSNGMVGKSLNGGKNWKWTTVAGFEKTDFRDIEAFDANVAIIMGTGEPAHVLKTIDGGNTWKIVYENRTKGMFLDAMDFSNNQKGIVIGDPVEGRIFMAITNNSGESWEEITDRPASDSGEAFFAASGSNIKYFANGELMMVSGGKSSRLFTSTGVQTLDLLQGAESTGANSIDVYDNGMPDKPGKRIVVVGGDFSKPDSTSGNCLYSTNRGKTWKRPAVAPHGYRSSVEFLAEKILICCGINGVDVSTDTGKTWSLISTEGFNTCRIARIGTAVYLAGNKGKIARLNWKP